MRQWLRRLNDYWFGYGSPVTMGVRRIFVGVLALANFLMVSIDFDAWFTERGYVPYDYAVRKMPDLGGKLVGPWSWWSLPFDIPRVSLVNFFDLGTSTPVMAFVYVLTLCAAVTTMLGLWTRVSTVLLAIGTVTIHHRNGFILHGGDTVLRIMVLYVALAPSGAACSLDRVIALWRGKISPAMPQVSLWPQRLVTYNVALVYLTTFWHKMRGDQWRNGTATWYPARLNEFDRFWVPSFFDYPPMVQLTTYGTLGVELALGTLVFFPQFRKWVLLAGLLMHAYIEYSMNIPLFAFVICSCYVSFFSGEEVQDWFRRLGIRTEKHRVRVWTPKGRSMRPGPAAALQAMDPLSLVAYTDGGDTAWTARNAGDVPIEPVKASWKRTLAAWPVGWIPGLWRRILDRSLVTSELTHHESGPSSVAEAVAN